MYLPRLKCDKQNLFLLALLCVAHTNLNEMSELTIGAFKEPTFCSSWTVLARWAIGWLVRPLTMASWLYYNAIFNTRKRKCLLARLFFPVQVIVARLDQDQSCKDALFELSQFKAHSRRASSEHILVCTSSSPEPVQSVLWFISVHPINKIKPSISVVKYI